MPMRSSPVCSSLVRSKIIRSVGCWCVLAAVMAGVAGMSGCSGTPKEDIYRPYFDGRFDATGRGDNKLFKGQDKVFVSDINSQYAFETVGLYAASAIDDKGAMVAGESQVLSIQFRDAGALSLVSIEDKTVVVRLQIENDGKVSKGWLSGNYNGVMALTKTIDPDIFMRGQVWFMYQDSSFASGQLDAEFNGFKINGNFRVLKRRRA
jgi:hypothetical protein